MSNRRRSRKAVPDGDALRLLQELTTPDAVPHEPHEWVVAAVYQLTDDAEARELATAKLGADPTAVVDAEASLTWSPGEGQEPGNVIGPYCCKCRKVRGDGPDVSLCTEAKPAWLRRLEANQRVRNERRAVRRPIEQRARRARRKAGLPDEFQQGARRSESLRRPSVMRVVPPAWVEPERVDLVTSMRVPACIPEDTLFRVGA